MKKYTASKIVALAIVLWAIFLIAIVALPGSSSSTILLPIIATASSLASLAAVVRLMLGPFKGQPQRREFTNNWLTQSLAVLIPILLIAGTYCAIKALWTDSLADAHTKFLYNGFANGLGFGAIAATVFLSNSQKSIYWPGGKDKTLKLDEMQIQERRKIFETSYKVSVWLVLISVYFLYDHIHSLHTIINDPTNYNIIPGAIVWPFGNIAIALFALPLVIASWPRKLTKN